MDAPSTPLTPRQARTSERPPPPLGVVLPARDPLTRVMDLGRKTPTAIVLAVLLAMMAHGTAAARVAFIAVDLLAWERGVRLHLNERLASTYEIEVAKPKEPEPPPAEEKKPDEPKEEAKTPPPPAPKDNTPPPPPAAAQAGAVLTQAPDPNDPVDFTNTFVSGTSATFAGGVTQQGGTSATAVYSRHATAQGVPGGTGTAPAPPAPAAVDRTRPPGLSGNRDWNCPFPSEADAEQIDDMYVVVEVTLAADGRVTAAKATGNPGHGFGRAGEQCAKGQPRDMFNVALDRDGNPVEGKRQFRIHFSR